MIQNEQKKIILCANHRANPNHPSCAARGSKIIATELRSALQAESIVIAVEESPCLGMCQHGPNLRLIPGGHIFNHVTKDAMHLIVQTAKDFLAE